MASKIKLFSFNTSHLPWILGIIAVFLSFIPAFYLGADCYVGISDQMDGEILVYIINALNLFNNAFPEFMNGMASTSLTPHLPAQYCFIYSSLLLLLLCSTMSLLH